MIGTKQACKCYSESYKIFLSKVKAERIKVEADRKDQVAERVKKE